MSAVLQLIGFAVAFAIAGQLIADAFVDLGNVL